MSGKSKEYKILGIKLLKIVVYEIFFCSSLKDLIFFCKENPVYKLLKSVIILFAQDTLLHINI
jgi:hypothetical protein